MKSSCHQKNWADNSKWMLNNFNNKPMKDEVMVKEENTPGSQPVAKENKETVLRLATAIEPALQRLWRKPRRKEPSGGERLANCYVGLLVDLVGRKGASTLLQNHAYHVLQREEGVN